MRSVEEDGSPHATPVEMKATPTFRAQATVLLVLEGKYLFI